MDQVEMTCNTKALIPSEHFYYFSYKWNVPRFVPAESSK